MSGRLEQLNIYSPEICEKIAEAQVCEKLESCDFPAFRNQEYAHENTLSYEFPGYDVEGDE